MWIPVLEQFAPLAEVKGRWGYDKLASPEKESGPQIEKRKGEQNNDHNPKSEAKF